MATIVPRNGPISKLPLPPPTAPRRPGAPPALTPTLFYDAATVASGQELPLKSKAFLNNRGAAVALHEMRVVVEPTISMFGTRITPLLAAMQITLRRKSGRTIPLTRGYVPVASICKSDNRRAETFGIGVGTLPEVGASSWQFSAPLYLAVGDSLEVQVKNLGIYNSPLIIRVAFAGASGAVTPSYRVPYVVYWRSRDFDYSETAVDSSPPDQLANDSGTELTVDRIIGRFVAHNSPSAPGDMVSDFGAQDVLYAMLRMSTAQNWPIVRDFTVFRAVFGQDAAMETAFTMAPNDFLNVDVQHLAGPAAPFTYFSGWGAISLVGCREAM